MYSIGTYMAEGEEVSYMGTDFLVRKLDPLKVGKPGREDNKPQTMNEKVEFLTFSF